MVKKVLIALTLMCAPCAAAFISSTPSSVVAAASKLSTQRRMSEAATDFELDLKIPPSSSTLIARMRIKKLLPDDVKSEIVEVRYPLPFGLDVEPKAGKVVCTKDGPGGEKVGDILRFTSAWSMGLPRGDGLITTAASFAGGLSWQCNMFDVMKAQAWQEVVEALTSNVDSRTDEVVLLFERKINSE